MTLDMRGEHAQCLYRCKFPWKHLCGVTSIGHVSFYFNNVEVGGYRQDYYATFRHSAVRVQIISPWNY